MTPHKILDNDQVEVAINKVTLIEREEAEK